MATMVRKYLLTTLGCKVNQYESQQLREVLETYGFRPAAGHEIPDVAVVNTCAVTAEASRKNRRIIRRLSRRGVTPVVAVGCGATADRDALRRLDGVAAVFGHDVDIYAELRALLRDRLGISPSRAVAGATRETTIHNRGLPVHGYEVSMIPSNRLPPGDAESPPSAGTSEESIWGSLPLVKRQAEISERIDSFAGHQRAFLKVQDGCDAFCTYCIIPRLRPALRSKPIEVAVAEACDLVKSGHKEIVLSGIFLGAYGRETAIRRRWPRGRSPLATLVQALAAVEGLVRIRLSSLEPGDVDDPLLEVLASHRNCVPHLHLPLQSGSADVLRRMNRQYTSEAFLRMIDRVRGALDRPAISTDIIVGFPGESEDDFRASLETAQFARFLKIHAFPFSPRERTAAARWSSDFIPEAVVRERMQRLADVERDVSFAFRRQFLGHVDRVIVEHFPHRRDRDTIPGRGIRTGRGDRYFEIHFEAADVTPGDLVSVRIDRVTPTRTHGAYLSEKSDAYPLAVLGAA